MGRPSLIIWNISHGSRNKGLEDHDVLYSGSALQPMIAVLEDISRSPCNGHIDVSSGDSITLGWDATAAVHARVTFDREVRSLFVTRSQNGKATNTTTYRNGDLILLGTTMYALTITAAPAASAIDSTDDAIYSALLKCSNHLGLLFRLADCPGIDSFLAGWRDYSDLVSTETEDVYLMRGQWTPELVKLMRDSGAGSRYGVWTGGKTELPGTAIRSIYHLRSPRWPKLLASNAMQGFVEAASARTVQEFVNPFEWLAWESNGKLIKIRTG